MYVRERDSVRLLRAIIGFPLSDVSPVEGDLRGVKFVKNDPGGGRKRNKKQEEKKPLCLFMKRQ